MSSKVLALATGPLAATGMTAPISAIWLPGAQSGHLWVSDSSLGFCRLDPFPNSTTSQLAPSTCVRVGGGTAGQAAFDPQSNSIYVANASPSSKGAYRLNYDPITETVNSPLLLAAGLIQDNGGPRAAELGPDGRLYLGLNKNGQIVRITNPGGPTQTVEPVGFTSNGLPAVAFSFVGNDLYIAEVIHATMISNAANCFPGSCNPTTQTGINILAPTALIYDGTTDLFVADFNTVSNYNPLTGVQGLYASAGDFGGTNAPISAISALGLDLQGNLLVGENPSQTKLGAHIWTLVPGATIPSFPPVDIPRPLASLKTVPVPEPSNLMDFVADKQAAIQLGKALFWDAQVGSDGKTACATCHFQAGADIRSKNQLDPGLRGGDSSFQLAGPNYTLQPRDFPFTKHLNPAIANSPIVSDTNDIASSQGVLLHNFTSIASGNPVEN